MLELARELRERTTLEKDDPGYMSPTSINANFAPLQKLFVANDVALPWQRIRDTFPEMVMYETRGWTRDEIRKMLRHARGAIDRAIILVMASSGVRIGGMELKWSHIIPFYYDGKDLHEGNGVLEEDASKPIACAMLCVYASSFAEYAAFITPEAYEAVQDYRAVWAREAGREPKPNDPFIKKAGQSVVDLTHDGIKQRAYKVIWSAGLRGSETKEGKRYNVPGMNGFRRFCNKAMERRGFYRLANIIDDQEGAHVGALGTHQTGQELLQGQFARTGKRVPEHGTKPHHSRNRELAARRQPEGCRH